MTLMAGIVGALVGTLVALVHHYASWRASHALVRSRRASTALLGLPLRVGLPAVAFVGLSRWSPTAMIAALVVFGVVEIIAGRRRLAREEA